MRGRALLEPAEHRPLGFRVLLVFTCPAVSPATGSYQARSEWDAGIPPATFQNFTPTESFSADLAKLPLMVRARPGSLRALFLWQFLQAACSCLYLCYHRLQLHCLKLTDSQWYLCLCASVYLDSFVFDEARTHAHINTPRCTGVIMLHTSPAVRTHTDTHNAHSLLVVVVLDILSISLCPKAGFVWCCSQLALAGALCRTHRHFVLRPM